MMWTRLALAILLASGSLWGCDNEQKEKAGDDLVAIGDGAVTYYQEEHADTDSLTVFTAVYPRAPERICDPDDPIWKKLRFEASSEAEHCYMTDENGRAFAATVEVDDMVLCLTGSRGPRLNDVTEVESSSDCEVPEDK